MLLPCKKFLACICSFYLKPMNFAVGEGFLERIMQPCSERIKNCLSFSNYLFLKLVVTGSNSSNSIGMS